MRELPEGWADAKIRDTVGDYETINPQKSPDQSFFYVDIGAIDNSVQKITAPKEFSGQEAPSRARRVIKANDVLFSTVRTYLKNVAQVPERLDGQLTSTGICVLRANEISDPGYLFRWVSSSGFIDEISESQDGTMYPAVRDEDVLSGPIPLPPLPEQRRIVRKLDSLSARTATARAHLTAIEKLVERYKAGLQAAALAGFLSGRRLFTPFDEWEVKTGADIFDWSSGTGLTKKEQQGGEIPVFGGNGIGGYHNQSLIDFATIVIGRVGAHCGNVHMTSGPSWVTDNAIYAKSISEDVSLEFARFVLSAEGLNDAAGGSGQPYVSQKTLNAVFFRFPPLEEQQEIARRIETAFANIDYLADEAQKALKLTDQLDQRILAKAFAGELVPQDPKDEPASELLDRIREARANVPKKPRKKPTKDKSMKVAPQERVLTDSAEWPEQGLSFEVIAKRLTLPHDDLKDAVFVLLEGDAPRLRQQFDTDAKVMKLVRVNS